MSLLEANLTNIIDIRNELCNVVSHVKNFMMDTEIDFQPLCYTQSRKQTRMPGEIADDKSIMDGKVSLPPFTRSLNSLDDKVSLFNEFILKLFDKHAPVRSKRMKHKLAPWLTDNIHALRSQRDSAYRKWRKSREEADYERYRCLRNKTNQTIITSKLDTHTCFSRLKHLQNPYGTV